MVDTISPNTSDSYMADPLVASVVLLYRRWWVAALGALAGLAVAWFAAPRAAPHFVQEAQLYIKLRPVLGGGRQDPINAVAYEQLLESERMRAAARGASSLDAQVEVTQDTNFGKYYSPVIDLRLTAATAETAETAMEEWRRAFLAAYGDLATRSAKQALARLEDRQAELAQDLRTALEAEVQAENKLRPLLLHRAELERRLAPYILEIPEPAPTRPRAMIQTRDQVVVQDITVAEEAVPPPRLEPLPADMPASIYGERYAIRSEDEITSALSGLSEMLATAVAEHRLIQRRRVQLEAELTETSRHAEVNRLLVAGATGAAPDESGEEQVASEFEASDVVWLRGPAAPRRVEPGLPAFTMILGALAGTVLAAAWILVADAARRVRA